MSAATATVADSTAAEVDACVQLGVEAARALDDVGPRGRATLLRNIAAALDEHGAALVGQAVEESALSEARLTGELSRTTFQLRFFAELVEAGEFIDATIDHADPDWPPAPRPDLRRLNRPLGPVAVFAGSNFPFAFSVVGGDTASALAAGCPVVVKAHPGHPVLSNQVADVARAAAGELADVLQIVHGYQAGPQLVNHRDIRAGAFTGSVAGGRALHDLATARPDPIPFYGELGSLNPVVVTPAAARTRLPEIAEGFRASFTLGVGQFCTKPGLLVVPATVDTATLVDALDEVPAARMLSRRITDGYRTRLAELGAEPGLEVVVAGDVSADAMVAPSLLFGTVAAVLSPGSTVLDECFGPSSVVVSYQDEDELLRLLDALPGQLTAGVFCDADPDEDDRRLTGMLLHVLAGCAGRVMINSWPTGVAVSWAMQHGGPYPAATSPTSTSVGAAAITRFLRPVAYQSVPDYLLPPELQESNPLALPRRVDGRRQARPDEGHST